MYNPYRGRDTYTRLSDGGTRYARLPPVIEIIPLSGYLLPHTHAYHIMRYVQPLSGMSYLALTHIDNTQRKPLSGYILPHTHAYNIIRYVQPLSGYILPHTHAYR